MKLFKKKQQPNFKLRGKLFYVEKVTEGVKVKIVDYLMKDETTILITEEQSKEIDKIVLNTKSHPSAKILTILGGFSASHKRAYKSYDSLAERVCFESENCELRIVCEAHNRILTIISHEDKCYFESIGLTIEEYYTCLRQELIKLIHA